jgi:opacity protein-like surface antigen
MIRRAVVVSVLGLLALAGNSGAATVTLPRPGQVGFSGEGHLGTLTKSGEYGDVFGTGAGIAIRARYRMRYERGLGLSFERQGFSARDDSDTLFAPRTLTLQTATLDVYQMFGTRTQTTRFLSASLGLSQGTQKLNGGDTKVGGIGTGDALVLGVGAGLERFVWQSWAVDLGARYFAHLHHSKVNHGVHVYAGMIFYAGY